MRVNPRHKPFAKVKLFSSKPKPRSRSRASPCQLASLRLHDLARLFRARYGVTLPDDEAGREDMMVAVNHLASLARPRQAIQNWIGLWCPWVTLAELETITTAAIMHQHHWTADQLAWRLNLIDEDRTYLGITTIGAVDCNKAERIKRRLAKANERVKRNRAKARGLFAP